MIKREKVRKSKGTEKEKEDWGGKSAQPISHCIVINRDKRKGTYQTEQQAKTHRWVGNESKNRKYSKLKW